MKKNILFISVCVLSAFLLILQINCAQKEMSQDELIARGKYLVLFGGCNDCHSPKVMTPMGPMPDTTRLLSGHPAALPAPKIDTSLVINGQWVLTSGLTMWVGPWGISYAANITPDSTIGIGAWTLENFTSTMRTGKHLGAGRMILPPMPFTDIAALNDMDIKALFTYLKSIPPINNRVPNPVPPNMLGSYAK